MFPIGRGGKLLTSFLLCAFAGPAFAQTPHHILIPRASRIDLSHTGIHTHANFLLFETGSLDAAALQRDTAGHAPLTIIGHSRLSTDHAALPPEYQALAEGDAPLVNPYGPIDGQKTGKPGWAAFPFTKGGRHWVKVVVPTRFANWVALQPKARQRRYLDERNYSLEIRWEKSQPPRPNNGGAREGFSYSPIIGG